MTNPETPASLTELEIRSELFDAMDGNLRMSKRRKLLDAYRDAVLAAAPAAVSVPPPATRADDRRARYAAAIAEGFRAFDADTTSDAYLDAELLDAVVAVADAEEAVTRADDRAAVLREVAARYEEILANADTGQDPRYWTAVRDITLGLRAMADEAPTEGVAPDGDLDLADGPVRCPLCVHTVTLHTPNGARAHFTAVHPEQRVTGRGHGPWPLLVTDGAEAQSAVSGPCVAGEEQQNETQEAERPARPECAHCWREIENRGTPNMGGPQHDNWVHIPGGFQPCFPQRGADSPRAEPRAAVVAQPGKETTSCSTPNACDPDDGPCDRHEREQSHAENDHSLCRRDECEVLRQS